MKNSNENNSAPVVEQGETEQRQITNIAPQYIKIPAGLLKTAEVTELMEVVSDSDGVPDVALLGRCVVVMVALTMQATLCGMDGLVGADRGGEAMSFGAIRRWITPDYSIAELREAIACLVTAGLLSSDDDGALYVATWTAWGCPTVQAYRDKEAAREAQKADSRSEQQRCDAAWASADDVTKGAVDTAFRAVWNAYPRGSDRMNYSNCRALYYTACLPNAKHGVVNDAGQPETDPVEVAQYIAECIVYMLDHPGSPISRSKTKGAVGIRNLRNAIKDRVWLRIDEC